MTNARVKFHVRGMVAEGARVALSLSQEQVINKMKRKTDTTEDSVEVNNTSKKVKQSSNEYINAIITNNNTQVMLLTYSKEVTRVFTLTQFVFGEDFVVFYVLSNVSFCTTLLCNR